MNTGQEYELRRKEQELRMDRIKLESEQRWNQREGEIAGTLLCFVVGLYALAILAIAACWVFT